MLFSHAIIFLSTVCKVFRVVYNYTVLQLCRRILLLLLLLLLLMLPFVPLEVLLF